MRELGWEPVDGPDRSTARPVPQRMQELASVLEQPACRLRSWWWSTTTLPTWPASWRRHAHPPAGEHELVLVANAPAGGADGLPQRRRTCR